MLAYASYLYTNDYGGDLYTPAVFQALTQSAGGRRSWSVHDSKITRMDIQPKSGHLLTVSDNGEFFIHKLQDGQLTAQQQIRDGNYCFRDVYAANNGQAYAISYTGHLMIVGRNQTKVIDVKHVDRPFGLQPMNDGRQLLIIGENSVALFDLATDKVIATRRLDFRVTSIGRRDYKPLLFDNRGRMHLVNSLDDISNEKVPVQGQVTAFASSKHDHLTAYGMADGTIWLTAGNGKTYKLVEHLSRVTEMEFNGHRLYSSSYDGRLLFWSIDYNSQMKAVTLFQSDSWLMDIIFSGDKDYIWTGEKNGTVSQYLVSLPKIAQRLRQNVKRNFTQEEWNYYVGKGIPYRELRIKN
jgi:WD40 repeat protein